MLKTLLFVMLGTGIGAALRYWVLRLIPSRPPFITAVCLVNALGSFTLGGLVHLQLSATLALFLETGLLGGFTTFSTMMTEGAEQDSLKQECLYLLIQVAVGFLSFYIGWLGFTVFLPR
ncbi:CrcB family protein [Fructobacillus sp. M2-14]|uniref:Fluoride-specific ion channel FluC n=1 Tax=Fructobacillus broussonetiae TaxID=2713173 RepID=A0ABS5R118_9LACO|nr:CrcB family protein [Fructobacillus broussonetiae]MBS9338702.1 CrcB family protein [Fructobacillus broussonetiae]